MFELVESARELDKKNPNFRKYRALTEQEIRNLPGGCRIQVKDGKIARNLRVTSVKTWKTRPKEVEVKWVYGVRDYGSYKFDFSERSTILNRYGNELVLIVRAEG